MHKKTFFIGASLFVIAAMSFSPVFAVSSAAPTTTMKEELAVPQKASDAGAMADTGVQKSSYVLPYPGLLPNHPLYFIKKFRDQIIEMLIVDPQRKSEFYLLQSDKYLSASVLLDQQGLTPLSQGQLDLSTQRVTDSVSQLSKVKQLGQPIPAGSIDRMNQALEKHLEVVDELTSRKTINTLNARTALLKAQDDVSKLKD